MRGTLRLRGSGFEWRLRCEPSREPNWIHCTMHLVASGAKQRLELGPLQSGAQPQELLRLASYLEEHLASLVEDPWHESPTFVWTELPFTVQALCGECDGDGGGSFSMRVLLNMGSQDAAGSNVYVGVEGELDVEECRRFVSALRNLGRQAQAS